MLLTSNYVHRCVAFLPLGFPRPQTASDRLSHTLVTIGNHIRKRRLDLGLLQHQVAAEMGISEATVWNWESGKRKPSIELMPAIINFLGYVPIARPCSLPRLLYAYRMISGYSQKVAASSLGIDPTTWRLSEGGFTKPRYHRVKALFEEKVLPLVDSIYWYVGSRTGLCSLPIA